MKKAAIVLIIVLFVCSCSSTPKEQPFTVDLKYPRYGAGSIEAYLDKVFLGGISKNEIEVYYYPHDDAVCLNFKVLRFINSSQFWDRDGREAFISALERYKAAYEQRELVVNKNKQTREAYGTVTGYFVWKKTPVAVQAHGSPKVRLGYQFKEKSAFFTTTQMESDYRDPLSRTRNQTSPVTTMYFTRLQAEALAALFSREFLQTLGPSPGDGGTGADYYTDEYW
jgi:hypothetical protein